MISLNGIQIDEAELKRQLEAQGWKCERAWPKLVWIQMERDPGGACRFRDKIQEIPDELIRAYDELYEQAQKNRLNQWGVPFLHDLCDKIAALKAHGEKR